MITISQIQRTVASFYGIKVEHMIGSSKSFRYAHPRQVAMVLCRELTPHSLPKIGAHFNRDHTTVIHAPKAVARRMGEGSKEGDEIVILRQTITTASSDAFRTRIHAEMIAAQFLEHIARLGVTIA